MPLSVKKNPEIHHFRYLNSKWIKLGVVKCIKSKLTMYPDVRNAEVTHSMLFCINEYLIET